MMPGEREKLAKLEAEVRRLEGELAVLERQWRRKHLLALFGIAAVPCYFLFGSLVALVVLLCTPVLVGTQAYLLWVRRWECKNLIAQAYRDAAVIRGELPPERTTT
jgi:hypothetical protein